MKEITLIKISRRQMTNWHKGKVLIPNYEIVEGETFIIIYYVKFNKSIEKLLTTNIINLRGARYES